MPDLLLTDAVLSGDGRYRYWLGRHWSYADPIATFIMLNPSTADASADDPTIRRCIGFARSWGMGGIVVLNLYALRATDPRELWKVTTAEAVGPDNDRHLEDWARNARLWGTPLIAAWGANAKPRRVKEVLALPGMHRLNALGVTKAGQPRHPLYLRRDAGLLPWEPTDA